MLYWFGMLSSIYNDDMANYSKSYAIYSAIIGLNTSTAETWKLMLDEQIAANYDITQYFAKNDCLSLLLTGKGDSTNTLLICQLYRDGQVIGMTQLKDLDQPYLYRIVDASPGSVSLFKQSEEG